MANDDHITQLLKGVASWNGWRSEDPTFHPELDEANLSAVNLSDANLRGANLLRANLSEANLSGADLRKAYLSEAYLFRADLSGADLSGADLREANLSEADLSGADLRDANFFGADLSGADLSGADLRGADLRQASLRFTNLLDADLNNADLTGSSAAGVDAAPQTIRELSILELADLRMATATLVAAAAGTRNSRHAEAAEVGWQVEAEARRQAEVEARRQAEAEAWRQAEAEAQRQAEVVEARLGDPGVPASDRIERLPESQDSRRAASRDDREPRPPAAGSRYRSRVLLIAAGVGLGLGLLWFLRAELFHLLFRSAFPPMPAWRDEKAEADIVDASAFAPQFGPAGGAVLVQIFFHLRKHAATTRKRAIQADREAELRGKCTLEMAVRHGQRISVKLDAPSLLIDQAVQSLTWRGEAAACQFRVAIPAELSGQTSHILASFFLDGAPVGEVRFRLDALSEKDVRPREPELRGESARHFEHAFLSYSSRDRQDVLKCAQTLDNAGIKFFMDIVSLRGGEHWEKRLYDEIDRSDLFMLFWSRNIEQNESIWIEKEATHALSQQAKSAEHLPTFKPTFLGRQKPQRPWWLPAQIQFDNELRRHMLAAAREGRVQAPSAARKPSAGPA
jgi:hypothetical protein